MVGAEVEIVRETGEGWSGRYSNRRAFLQAAVWSGATVCAQFQRSKGHYWPQASHASLSKLRPIADRRVPSGTTVAGTNDPALGTKALPALEARLSAGARDGVQVFKSRPDLAPPAVLVDVPAAPAALPGVVLTNAAAGPGQQGALIIDADGQLVWFLAAGGAHNLQVQSYKGKAVLSWFEGVISDDHGSGHYELCDSAYREIAQVYAVGGYQGDLHEFLLTASGSALFTCYGQSTADFSKLGGLGNGSYYYGVVQEVDVATGRLLFEWRSDEHVGFEESYIPVPKSGSAPWDYFHINSIDVDRSDGNLIVSSRNTWSAYKLDRRSGAVLWRLGGKNSDFAIGAGAHFAFQHDVRRHPDGTLTLFDDEGGPPDEASQSRGLVLVLDEQTRNVKLLKQYHHSPPVLTEVLGSTQELIDGHYFVGWGKSSYFTEYDASGRAVFDGRLAAGTSSYRAFKQPWKGQPAGPPAIAVVAGNRTATVYASWNGATGVTAWSVLGGSQLDQLQPVGVGRCLGFETAITVPDPQPYLAVEATDGTGAAIGRSEARPLR
jgi:Arylsulfotransferase (ASST)